SLNVFSDLNLLVSRRNMWQTYADMFICNQSKLRYQKTSAVHRCPVTVFNEVLMFSLPDVPLEQCKILVSVYETQSTGRSNKCLLGQLSVGKDRSSEDEHWTLMVRSVRQPVAKWHGLLL
uniref:C2 domain-containing protein n=1 Tax=Poecilia reticulata TaxID=8081 RepID=A0A3P9PUT1_POERE